MKKNASNLATIATAWTGQVLTSSTRTTSRGPPVPEVDRIKRAGIVNAVHDENFSNAVNTTGGKKVVRRNHDRGLRHVPDRRLPDAALRDEQLRGSLA